MARELGGTPEIALGDAVAIIGDGSMSAGMAFEAMNNAGHLKKRMFVILNDNDMSIAPPVGALSSYLARLYEAEPFAPSACCPRRCKRARAGPRRCSRA